jgi:hypothetical protein
MFIMAGEGETAFKIVDISKVPSAEPGRAGKYDLIVTYQDVAGRVRIVTIPYEEWEGKSPEEQEELLRKYIRAQEEERLRFIGKEIKI